LRGDGGIGAAPRLAAAHRAAGTNAPGGHLNQTLGEGACVSHVAACAVLGPPAPSKAPHNLRVPAKGRADQAATCIKTCTDMYAHRSVNGSVCIEGEKYCQELVRRYTNTCQFRCI